MNNYNPAEFEQTPSQARGDGLRDGLTHPGRSCRADQRQNGRERPRFRIPAAVTLKPPQDYVHLTDCHPGYGIVSREEDS